MRREKECETVMDELIALADRYTLGTHLSVEHDGFEGEIIGYYKTKEGKAGLVLQQHGTRVVHVYGVKWFPNA